MTPERNILVLTMKPRPATDAIVYMLPWSNPAGQSFDVVIIDDTVQDQRDELRKHINDAIMPRLKPGAIIIGLYEGVSIDA